MENAHLEAFKALRGQGDQTFGERVSLDVMNPDERRAYYSAVVDRTQARQRQNPQATVTIKEGPPRTRGSYVSEDDWIP